MSRVPLLKLKAGGASMRRINAKRQSGATRALGNDETLLTASGARAVSRPVSAAQGAQAYMLLLFMLVCSFSAFAQQAKPQDDAMIMFKAGRYEEAAKIFAALAANDPT